MTNSLQIHFGVKRENIQIDFDDSKIGDYNLRIDNFHESGTGTVYIDSIESKIEPQQYNINWTGVVNNANDAVVYEIDTDNDGNYEDTISLPPVYHDNIAPNTSYNFSGELISNSTGTYIESVTIDLNAIDNDGGIGVDEVYYAIGTDTGSLVYLPYTEPVIVNGVGDYTLNYYAVDKFGNTEENKIINFSLIESSETYSGNISGYVYEDKNNNGVQDDGEKSLKGWKILLSSEDGKDCYKYKKEKKSKNNKKHKYKHEHSHKDKKCFVVTDKNGYYEFDGLETGIYYIQEILHKNWIVTNPLEGKYIINLQNGQRVEQKNFGNIKVKGGKK